MSASSQSISITTFPAGIRVVTPLRVVRCLRLELQSVPTFCDRVVSTDLHRRLRSQHSRCKISLLGSAGSSAWARPAALTGPRAAGQNAIGRQGEDEGRRLRPSPAVQKTRAVCRALVLCEDWWLMDGLRGREKAVILGTGSGSTTPHAHLGEGGVLAPPWLPTALNLGVWAILAEACQHSAPVLGFGMCVSQVSPRDVNLWGRHLCSLGNADACGGQILS